MHALSPLGRFVCAWGGGGKKGVGVCECLEGSSVWVDVWGVVCVCVCVRVCT